MTKDTGKHEATFKEELIHLINLSIPLVVSSASAYSGRLLTTIFTGRYLTTDEFDAAALGFTMTNITGYSMIIAMVSPMDSLCTQAYGANNWKLFALTIYRALFCTSIFLIPTIILWLFMYDLMIFIGQNEIVSYYVQQWTSIYITILPALVTLCVATRFLSSQSIGKPLLYLGIIVYCIWHPIWLYFIFIYLKKRDFIWAPLSNIVTVYIHVISIILYCIILKPHNKLSIQYISFTKIIKWQTNLKIDTFININNINTNIEVIDKGMKEYIELLIAGIFSLCAEWWSWEVITLICGLLGPIQLATHVIFATIMPFYYMIPMGVGLAGAARIGKLIGQNQFHLAKYLAHAILWFTLIESVVIAILSFCFREYIPFLFTNEKQVINIAIKVSPLFSIFVIWDAFQGSFQGILRGIKKQGKSVIGVIIGPWIITIPLACLLAFDPIIDLKIIGMWIGNNVGYIVMNIIFLYIFWTFNWNKKDNINTLNDKEKTYANTANNEQYNTVIPMNISHFSAFLTVTRF
eukprot:200266_1